MLLRTVSLNRTVSWVTMPTCARNEAESHIAHVIAVDQQAARGDIEKARQQMNQRALAGTARADDGQISPRLTSRSMSCSTSRVLALGADK